MGALLGPVCRTRKSSDGRSPFARIDMMSSSRDRRVMTFGRAKSANLLDRSFNYTGRSRTRGGRTVAVSPARELIRNMARSHALLVIEHGGLARRQCQAVRIIFDTSGFAEPGSCSSSVPSGLLVKSFRTQANSAHALAFLANSRTFCPARRVRAIPTLPECGPRSLLPRAPSNRPSHQA
jgi:hypothetical protein